jgi:hypothetical protein
MVWDNGLYGWFVNFMEIKMKQKILTVLFLVFILSSVSAQAENDFTFSFQANPFIYLMDFISLGIDDDSETYAVALEFEFQYAINSFLNVSIAPQFVLDKDWYIQYSDGDTYYAKQYQFIITLGVLYRPFNTRLKGMYIGTYIPIGFSNISVEGYTKNWGYGFMETVPSMNDYFTLLGFGLSAGYQWIFRNGFTISLGAGGQKIWSIASKNNIGTYREAENLFKLPFALTLTFRLGYSF